MLFNKPLVEGKFIKRYKRFFADVELEGNIVTAHVPNTGSLKSCNISGSPCRLSVSDDPKRALKFTLEAIQAENEWVGVNTSWPNKLAVDLFKEGTIKHWKKFDSFQQEIKINEHSRIDLGLWDSKKTDIKKWKVDDFKEIQPIHFVEIKNVTLKEGDAARFPDAVTERGQKHIEELRELVDRGFTAEMLFIIQRNDIKYFEPAADIDPVYAKLLKKAFEQGVKMTAVSFQLTKKSIEFEREVPIQWK